MTLRIIKMNIDEMKDPLLITEDVLTNLSFCVVKYPIIVPLVVDMQGTQLQYRICAD
jgi:hypothetical protein